MKKRILFSLCVALAATAWSPTWAADYATLETVDNVEYLYPVYNSTGADSLTSGIKEWKTGHRDNVKVLENHVDGNSSLAGGWYVALPNCTIPNCTISIKNAVCDSSAVHIILADGANLTAYGANNEANPGINTFGRSLTIYGQTNQTGTLTATGDSDNGGSGAGIGSRSNQYSDYTGNITINGGVIKATGGGSGGAGIGGGHGVVNPRITINGGIIEAQGMGGGAGIGGGQTVDGSHITINGGTVKATGGNYAAGIGGGGGDGASNAGGSGHDIIINGGTVTATGSNGGAGIGGGRRGVGGGYNITINGGIISATGQYAAGIGGGLNNIGSNITINGGKVTATATYGGPGIGGGKNSYGSNITINGGFVTATGDTGADGIGNGNNYTTTSSGIVVNDTVNVMAGASDPPSKAIHACGQGIANITDSLVGKRYVVTDMALTFSDNMSKNEITDYVNVTTDVTIGRTFYKDGKNNTICLPFSLTNEQLNASPLTGYSKLQELESAVIENEGEENETLTLTMTDVETPAITAGKPYIIVWPNTSSTIVNPKFEDVTITTDADSSSAKVNGVTFCGTMMPYAVEADDKGIMFVGEGGALNWPNVGGNINGFRAYFTVDLSANSPLRRGMAAMLSDGRTSPTAIEEAEIEAKVAKLIESGRVVIISNGVKYDLNGRIIE